MSRLGKKPIPIPKGVEVKIEGNTIIVKGPKGTIKKEFPSLVNISVDKENITCNALGTDKAAKELWGLWSVYIKNMLIGVSQGYKKVLDIQGVGYKAEIKGKDLIITVGYSHPVVVKMVEGVTFKLESPTSIVIEGIDNQIVGKIAAEIRAIKKPEPYKGKGIRYRNEFVRHKVGKAAATATAK